jgi:hypothetical protein
LTLWGIMIRPRDGREGLLFALKQRTAALRALAP